MKILVTGGAGFVGSHLVNELLQQGYFVTVWDSMHTGSQKNLAGLSSNDRLTVHSYDVREPHDFQGDVIINLACPASPVHYQKDPIYTWETSILGIHNLLRLAEKNGIKLLHASTSEVYGDPLEHPQRESYWGNVNTIGIRSCYDEGKRAAETLCADYARTGKADARLFRIFNTYGPHMLPDDGRVVSNFCVQALSRKPLTLYGNGMQTRSFCYVSDLVRGIIALMNLDQERYDGPVNLGNPNEFTIKELANELSNLMGKELDLEYKPLPLDDPQKRKPDIAKARSLLGWEPLIPLKEGLKPTLEYFRKRLQEQNEIGA